MAKLDGKTFTTDELREELRGATEEYQNLQFDHITVGLENPLKIREIRRDVARIKTELRKRELAEASEEEVANRSKIRARRRQERQASKVARRKKRK